MALFDHQTNAKLVHALRLTVQTAQVKRDSVLDPVIALPPEGEGGDYADGMADNLAMYNREVQTIQNALANFTLSQSGVDGLTNALARAKATKAKVTKAFGGGERRDPAGPDHVDHASRTPADGPLGGPAIEGPTAQRASRKVITARTRRWSPADSGRLSLARMLRTCFSTVPSVTQSRPAMPALERPSAISASTSRSRALSTARGSLRRCAPTSSCTSAGSTTDGPPGDPVERADELVDVHDPALEQVADPLAAGQQRHRVLDLDVRREDQDGDVGKLVADRPGRVQPLGGVGGRHPDVDQD